jgi:proprotein convertase subtilisin/kexin type 5
MNLTFFCLFVFFLYASAKKRINFRHAQEPCKPNCIKCDEDFSDECAICEEGFNLDGNYDCIICPEGKYFEPSYGRKCQFCPAGCKSCESLEKCLTCHEGISLESGRCKCPIGFYIKRARGSSPFCDRCQPNCNSCYSATSCSECAEGFHLNIQLRQCERLDCGENEVFDVDKVACKCLPGFARLENGKCGICPEKTYISSGYDNPICLNCIPGCTKCESVSSCLVCDENRVFEDGFCKCSPGFYTKFGENYSSSCERCPTNCASCATFELCSECAEGFNLNLESGLCV